MNPSSRSSAIRAATQTSVKYPSLRATHPRKPLFLWQRNRRFADSPLAEDGSELVWGCSCQVVILVCSRFFVRSGKAVLRSLIAPQVAREFCHSKAVLFCWL